MSFIGVVAGKKCFENIKKKISEELKDESINFIQINLRSIENIKNIKFETIIVEDNINKFNENEEILKKICKDTKFIIINTDKNKEQEQKYELFKPITYGLNQKAMITVSSISDTDILVYCQKSLPNREGQTIEIEERRIKKAQNNTLKTYEILIIYTFLKVYNKGIIEKI